MEILQRQQRKPAVNSPCTHSLGISSYIAKREMDVRMRSHLSIAGFVVAYDLCSACLQQQTRNPSLVDTAYNPTLLRFEILSAVVSQQQQQPDWRGLTRLSLSNIPYTDALTSAVRSAAPHLAYLDVYSYDLDAATPGLCRLITTTAPSITSLTFGSDLHSVLPPLADAIATCIRLQHLQVSLCARAGITKGDTPMQASTLRVLELVRTLPTLRSLNLSWYAGSEFGPLLDVMSTLTQLTSLRLNAHSVAPGRVINTLRPLASLARLTLVGGTVDEAAFGALAVGHGQLTHLAFEDFQLLLDSTQAGRRSCVPLPAALRELLLGCNVKPRELLALQLPPSLTQLRVDGLQVSAMTHTDAETDAGEDAGGVLAASPSPCPGFDELLQAVGLLCGSYDAHELYLKYQREASPRTWPAIGDGNVRLFKALRPLGLRRLVCRDCALDLRDVAALAEHLPELQVCQRAAGHCSGKVTYLPVAS